MSSNIHTAVEQWDLFELILEGPQEGNPFLEINLEALFLSPSGASVRVHGFYDGEGRYSVRFMPEETGTWSYRTDSSNAALNGKEGHFICLPATGNNHGPVQVRYQYHFGYADGTPYFPMGTTCYAWTHQDEALQKETLVTLQNGPFNKMRMCVFPKSYQYNENEPPYHAFEGSQEAGWDESRFNPAFFRHLEQRIADLRDLGIEADLILFHPYDRWGYAKLSPETDDRYLRYITARLSAYRNVWWSLANEYDLMKSKTTEDWERFATIVTDHDPYGHLISIHNCGPFYDYTRPWITHCSVQRVDVYRTAENTDQWRQDWQKPIVIDECAYEGNIDWGWGNITGQEMVRRFWEGAVRGGYVGHGETYVHPEEILWWSKGGQLHGSSPQRIGFLKQVLEEGPEGGLNPLPSEWDVPRAGIVNHYYLYYFGFNQPSYRHFRMDPGTTYQVDIIDTWEMTVQTLEGIYEGTFRVDLPGKPYIAVRLRKA